MSRTGLTWAALILLAGCPHRDPWPLGGDGGDGPPDAGGPGGIPDARPTDRVDARPGDRDAGVPTDCDVRMDLGDLGRVDGEAASSGPSADPNTLYFTGQLDDNPKPDILLVELYKGFGAFAMSITTGTFTLTGPELNYATCGVCVRLMANFDMATGDIAEQYFATGGTVQLTSMTGNMTGSLSGIRLEHVTINPTSFESVPVNDGCVTRIDSAAFDEVITAGP